MSNRAAATTSRSLEGIRGPVDGEDPRHPLGRAAPRHLAAISELVDHVDSRTMELVAGRDPDEKTPPSTDEP
jgi:hypothetical protein